MGKDTPQNRETSKGEGMAIVELPPLKTVGKKGGEGGNRNFSLLRVKKKKGSTGREEEFTPVTLFSSGKKKGWRRSFFPLSRRRKKVHKKKKNRGWAAGLSLQGEETVSFNWRVVGNEGGNLRKCFLPTWGGESPILNYYIGKRGKGRGEKGTT